MTPRWIIPCLVLFAAAPRAAEPNPDALERLLEEKVVSSASQAAETLADAPATVTVVGRTELWALGIRSIDEAVNFFSVGLFSQNGLASPETGSRGVLLSADFGNHVLVLVDGHTMNEAWDGTAYVGPGLGIPLEAIDHLELITGPGSVLYGSYAMLGVVNVVTRAGRELRAVTATASGALNPPLDEHGAPGLRLSGLGRAGRVSVTWGDGFELGSLPVDVLASLELLRHHGQDLDWRPQPGFTDTDGTASWPTNFGPNATPGTWGGRVSRSWYTEETAGLLRVRVGDLEAMVHAAMYRRGAPYFGNLTIASAFDAPESHEQDLWLDLDLRWRKALSPRAALSLRGYLDAYEYSNQARSWSWSTDGDPALTPAGVNLASFGFDDAYRAPVRWGGAEAQARVDWLGDGRFELLAGVDARLSEYSSHRRLTDLDGHLLGAYQQYQHSGWSVAPYVQQRALLGHGVSLNLGLRLDLHDAFAPQPSPRAALIWATPWNGRLRAVATTAFRVPTGYERFDSNSSWLISNPGLRPERVASVELAYEQRLGRHAIALVGFASQFRDLIRFGPAPLDLAPDGRQWYANSSELFSYGASLRVDGPLGPLRYVATVTASSTSQSDAPVVMSPAWFGNARLLWSPGEARWSLALASFFMSARPVDQAFATGADASGDSISWAGGTTAPAQVDLRAVVTGPLPGPKGLTVRLTAGGSVNAWGPYVVGPLLAPTEAGQVPQLTPMPDRLFVHAAMAWTLELAPARGSTPP